MASSSGLSREFSALVRSIGESKSKGEEDSIITTELVKLKNTMCGRGPGVSSHLMKEYLLRMLYAEMLGHDASFGHVSAVKLCSSARNLSCKRVAYLAVSAFLSPNSDLLLLLVNTLQTDLQSANQLEVQMALQLVCRLMSPDLVPPLIQPILKAASHMQASVRKKAVITLWRCCQIAPDIAIANEVPLRLKSMLCDKDPSVMGATLPALLELDNIKDLCPSIVSILKQIVEHRLSRDYDYRRIPAPWIQIKLIQLIGKIAANDKGMSQSCYEVLHEVMRRADTGINIGYAVIYECVRTVCTIFPNSGLLDEAAKQVSRFISSEYHNRKYLGIDALASLVKVEPRYALDHQLVVIDCLDSPDETLRRKTLDLLYRMTGPHNVTVIVDAMMKFITSPNSDKFLRKELVTRITSLSEKFAPDMFWYMDIFNQLLAVAGEMIPYSSIHSVFRLLSSDSALDQRDEIVRRYAARLHEFVRDDEGVTPIMVQVVSWILGEFADPEEDVTVLQDLCDILPRIRKPLAQSCILAALTKLICRFKIRPVPRAVLEAADRYQHSVAVDLQQRCYELFAISQMDPAAMSEVLPPMQSFSDVEVDPMLSFLDGYVASSVAEGAASYNRPDNISLSEPVPADSHLKYTPYAAAVPSFRHPSPPRTQPVIHDVDPVQVEAAQHTSSGLKLAGITRKWGPSGYGAASDTSISPNSQSAPAGKSLEAHSKSISSPKSAVSSAVLPQRTSSNDSMKEKEARAALLFGGTAANPSASVASSSNASLPTVRKVSNTSTAARTESTTTPSVDDLLDIGSLKIPASTVASVPQPSVLPSNDPIADLLSSFNTAVSPTSSDTSMTSHFQLPAYPLCPSFLRSPFAHLARSSEDDLLAAHNDCICASTFTVFKDDDTILIVFIQNFTSMEIGNLTIRANMGSGVVSIRACDGEVTERSTALSAEFLQIGPNQVVACLVSLTAKSPVLDVALNADYNQTTLPVWQTVPIVYFIRPLQLTTPQFGQMWLERNYTQNEKRLSPFANTPDQMAAHFNRMRIYTVQTINQESIAAAQIGSHKILLHLRFDSSAIVYVTVRASSSEALKSGIEALRAEIKQIK